MSRGSDMMEHQPRWLLQWTEDPPIDEVTRKRIDPMEALTLAA